MKPYEQQLGSPSNEKDSIWFTPLDAATTWVLRQHGIERVEDVASFTTDSIRLILESAPCRHKMSPPQRTIHILDEWTTKFGVRLKDLI